MNRHALLPTQEQLQQARLIAHAARELLLGRIGNSFCDARLLYGRSTSLHGRMGRVISS